MKTLAIIATVAATLSAPAFADTSAAIAHFNADKDSSGDLVMAQLVDERVTVSTRSGNFGQAVAIFNGSKDSQADLIGGNATLVSGSPAVAADVFARIKAEGLENE